MQQSHFSVKWVSVDSGGGYKILDWSKLKKKKKKADDNLKCI